MFLHACNTDGWIQSRTSCSCDIRDRLSVGGFPGNLSLWLIRFVNAVEFPKKQSARSACVGTGIRCMRRIQHHSSSLQALSKLGGLLGLFCRKAYTPAECFMSPRLPAEPIIASGILFVLPVNAKASVWIHFGTFSLTGCATAATAMSYHDPA